MNDDSHIWGRMTPSHHRTTAVLNTAHLLVIFRIQPSIFEQPSLSNTHIAQPRQKNVANHQKKQNIIKGYLANCAIK